MGSSAETLSDLQRDLLAVAADDPRVWLTGGAALGGFHIGHRRSEDLDFFTDDRPAIDELAARLDQHCRLRGWSLTLERRFPGFERWLVEAAGDGTKIDLVHEQAVQVVAPADKPVIAGLRVDPLLELRANKLAALLGRGETKDLVDLYVIAEAGLPPLDGLEAASRKDAGVEPATLAWVLSSTSPDPSRLLLETDLQRDAIAAFRDHLIEDLQRLAHPRPPR
ncbi:MAG: nucleotidyl transferase AbiEii/AbiGii toxin family protein [Myxococcota bacterium]